MSKPVKSLILDMYRKNLGGINQAMLVDLRGITANDNNALRADLAKKQIRVTVLKNALARKVFSDTELAPLKDMIVGPSALIHGADSVVTIAREMMDWAKKNDKVQLKGAVLEGTVFGADQLAALSKYPTKAEAQAQVVSSVLSPGRKLVGSILSPGRKLASIIKAIEEKLEKGETIAKVA